MVCIKETNFYLLVWHSNHTTSLCFSLLAAYDESMEAFPTNGKVSEDFGAAKDIRKDGLVLESKVMMDHLTPNKKDKIVQKFERFKREEHTSYVSLVSFLL
jgi:hypothetical protein